MSTLYIVATPIGNLEDITLRALRVFKEVDVVFAEDTREAKKLLNHFEITTPIERYDEHSHDKQAEKIIEYLEGGKSVAYVSDAGTPGISDPGARLVSYVRHNCPTPSVGQLEIVPLPGASAVTAALSASGLSADQFVFLGFVPHKKGRQTFFEEVRDSNYTTVFYESPHRILKTLESLVNVLGIRPLIRGRIPKKRERIIVVGRELTKIHEEIISGLPQEIFEHYTQNPDKVRGEFVVMVDGK